MTKIYYSKKLILPVILASVILIVSGFFEDNLAYEFSFILVGLFFLLSALLSLKVPALRISETAIYSRTFFGLFFKKVLKVDIFTFKKLGKNKWYFYDSDGKIILKLGFLEHAEVNEIISALKLKF